MAAHQTHLAPPTLAGAKSSKWTQQREAARVKYDAAAPARNNWKTAGTYTGAELNHRSATPSVRHPSIVCGQRVY